MLFVAGLPRAVGNRELRALFETIGPIEAAAVTVNFGSGMTTGKAVALFREVEHAVVAKREPPLGEGFAAQTVVTDFRIKIERRGAGGAPEPQQVVQVVQAIPRARDCLRTLIAKQAGIELKEIGRLVGLVQGMGLDQLYAMLQSSAKLEEWSAKQSE
jgi:hypothetical protein